VLGRGVIERRQELGTQRIQELDGETGDLVFSLPKALRRQLAN
jgi:hypothetical protein